MKICFVVRSLFSQIPTYTTTHLAFEAHRRGHEVVYSTLNSFSCTDDMKVMATGVSFEGLSLPNRHEFLRAMHTGLAEKKELCLSDFDVLFLRYNPNESEMEKEKGKNPSIEFGRLLKLQGVMVVNDPGGLTKASSKMYLSSFPSDIRAKTLITRSSVKIKEFLKSLKKPAIIKPLSGFGGQDVFFVKNPKDININQIITSVSKNGYVMAQEYLPAVKKGDKRILLLNGYPVFVGKQPALYLRVSPQGEIRSNMHIGGRRKKTALTSSDVKIIEAIRPKLVSDGLYFVGIDIVGNKLLEVNVFCPGGINNINELYGINVGKVVIQDLERQVRYRQSGLVTQYLGANLQETAVQ
ncbi:MAG: glutathione synthase [Proteobacteria bacterium]|nr:glutathione synthase [Pseudomonadota bacterium]NDC24790.1 glutathione synthase [Pseudomonadota bacterium]NDD04684.1 glutathione synthase [Pseudomonadota bacterium]NDG27370.1 glutathione synthase [Pseudomonadota bacterium]